MHVSSPDNNSRRLAERAREALSKLRGIRKPRDEDIFRRLAYIFPSDLEIVNYRKRPVAAFNPGAVLVGRELWVFPRLIFDYYGYTSSIGFFKLDIEKLLNGEIEKPIETKVILWPRELWEFRGCEDPRAHIENDVLYLLYTGLGFKREDLKTRRPVATWVQALAILTRDLEVKYRDHFRILHDGSELDIKMKDSAFLSISGKRASMLCRPTIDDIEIGWLCRADLEKMTISEEDLEPVMVYENWELKIGWSTNSVKISSNEYLVGWHGVLEEDYSYRNGLAVVDTDGNLLAVTNYVLSPRGVVEEYGDRPLVIFGNGLVLYRDVLIWVGGISDYAIGIFATEISNVMEKLHWLHG